MRIKYKVMKDKIREIRDIILVEVWDRHKAEWDMDEIAKAIGTNIKTAYRIIKKKNER